MKKTESTHEDLFQDWLDEARLAGIITVQQNPLPYTLCEQVWVPYLKKGVRKNKRMRRELLKPWTYTPDFIFYWNPAYKGKLFVPFFDRKSDDPPHALFWANQDVTGAYYSVVDVKASINRFGQRNSDITFPLAQKMLYKEKGIYVQKIVAIPLPKDKPEHTLIGGTWVPQNYKAELFYKRDYKRNGKVIRKKGECKVDWSIRSLIDFV